MSDTAVTKATFNLPTRELDELKELARRRSISVTHTLRQALATESIIQGLADQGTKFLVQGTDGDVRELVFNQVRRNEGK